jgi:6-pyruvoyltetrahydropterin/6-carboxytetrahydropterin synthase
MNYVKDHFAAAHALKGYDGNCSNLHGHNWIIEAHIQCKN